MSWTTDRERLNKLFDHVTHEVAASGGDGSGVVVFRQADIQEVAKAFEEWKAATKWPQWLPHRIDYSPMHVLFTDRSNENVTFVSKAIADTWPPEVGCHDEVWLEVW